jgi:hypothetical protein
VGDGRGKRGQAVSERREKGEGSWVGGWLNGPSELSGSKGKENWVAEKERERNGLQAKTRRREG